MAVNHEKDQNVYQHSVQLVVNFLNSQSCYIIGYSLTELVMFHHLLSFGFLCLPIHTEVAVVPSESLLVKHYLQVTVVSERF